MIEFMKILGIKIKEVVDEHFIMITTFLFVIFLILLKP